jgi:hypothetical protein
MPECGAEGKWDWSLVVRRWSLVVAKAGLVVGRSSLVVAKAGLVVGRSSLVVAKSQWSVVVVG